MTSKLRIPMAHPPEVEHLTLNIQNEHPELYVHTLADEVRLSLLTIRPGGKRGYSLNGTEFVVYYDEHQAFGDDGKPVKGDKTGAFQVATIDFEGLQRHLTSQHVGPHGTSGYGNPMARSYAAERIAEAMAEKALRPKRTVYP